MPYLLPLLAIATAVGVAAYLFAQIEQDPIGNEEENKIFALGVAILAGLLFPLTWLVIIVYTGAEVLKNYLIDGEEEN